MTVLPSAAQAQTYDCTSPDPARWPLPAKPYVMVGFDTSGSMAEPMDSMNSCRYAPNDRLAHGKCALKNAVLAYSGQVNFGLASFAREPYGCASSTCDFCNDNDSTCSPTCRSRNIGMPGLASGPDCPSSSGCGPESNPAAPNSPFRAGANILVPMRKDTSPPSASNVPDLLSWVDNNCTGSRELFSAGCTPLNGMLRDLYRYYSSQWAFPETGVPTYTSPLTSVALGERACRSVNVIFITDSDETCDQRADAIDAAAHLFAGFDKDGLHWSVNTYVIDFGDAGADANRIAAAGGTVGAIDADDETGLSAALAYIIGRATQPEVCNNMDDNCNGCIDEGYKHYCDIQPVTDNCCTDARATCLANYQASITPSTPNGNLALLPCTTAAQSLLSDQWLCFDPKERCDDVDNNCSADAAGVAVDEGFVKCGSPRHCPQTEVCNRLDDNCDGHVDEGDLCGRCVPSVEVCDGCDNDCDGIADNGIAPLPCGLTSPPNCAGIRLCRPPQAVPIGGCTPGGGYGTCTDAPQTEVCDGLDNNCDGQIDNDVPPAACTPPGTLPGLHYGPPSRCEMGSGPCGATCQGFVGPSAEVCDGIDNDCNGIVDDAPFGVGIPCGVNQPPCTTGLTACMDGALVCQGGTSPQPERCDSIDNNCNGLVDETPLDDAPAAGANGCWTNPGTTCQFPPAPAPAQIAWSPPPGASCDDNGSLTPPCNHGTLHCIAGAWTCTNAQGPSPETCDDLDNDCNDRIDDNLGSPVGDSCGIDTGQCQRGLFMCNAGVLGCSGDIPPVPETCDGLDNDCDGVIDNDIMEGSPCMPDYNLMDYPGDRSRGACRLGVRTCNVGAGSTCVGGIAPSPEVCDGVDNDCDGQLDEAGPPPDGIDGTLNQHQPPAAAIGDLCGSDVGACLEGAYACVNGHFACLGGKVAVAEQCDCLDNDCDGSIDNPVPADPALCSSGKECVKSGSRCQCAAPCSGQFPCPPGQECMRVTRSGGNDDPIGNYCVIDYDAMCGDCTTQTVHGMSGQVTCAPAGMSPLANCVAPPVCTCKQQNRCQDPCFGVSCPAGLTCTNYGPHPGSCTAANNCWLFPCVGCDKACHAGSCVTNPCTGSSCPAGRACKPSADFTTFTCVPSCATVTCPSGQACVDGACEPSCEPACMNGQVCDRTRTPPTCIANPCEPNPCVDGSCCNPLAPAANRCGDCVCEGVECPDGQVCEDGSCFGDAAGGGGGDATTGSGTGGSTTSGGASSGGGGSSGVWGLATGGGGCAYEVSPGATSSGGHRWVLAALALGLSRWRRRRRSMPPKRGAGSSRSCGSREVAR